jgi:hypothetical protein
MTSEVKSKLESNQQTLYVFSVDSLLKEAKQQLGKSLSDYTISDTKKYAGYYVPIVDTMLVLKIIKDLGITGEAITKNVSGKQYVILKGLPGNRKILTGTRYLASNPKVIKMAIGTKAVNKSIISGSIITLFITVPLSVLEVCLKDQFTIGRLLGTVASDITKIMISLGASSLAAMAVGAVSTIAAGPLIAAIFIGVAVGISLESIDQRFGITEKLISAIENELGTLYDRTIGEFKRGLQRVESILEYQMKTGIPLGQGLFY